MKNRAKSLSAEHIHDKTCRKCELEVARLPKEPGKHDQQGYYQTHEG